MISLAMQQYAAEIYRLQQDHPYVTLSMLSENAGTSFQATSRMIRRLRKAELVAHERYKGVRLTPAGERVALPAIRRHRLTEVFLVRMMHFGWEEVHDLVDELEVGINKVLEDRMDELTGHPTRCPHGEPIPTKAGVMPILNDRSLTTLEPGTRGEITRVRTHNPDKLRYLGDLGLVPGIPFELLAQAPFNGPLRIRTGKQEHVLGAKLARVVWVEVTSPTAK